jgi:gamma-glutamylcyclotransferase
MSRTFHYFAFGSNMLTRRLTAVERAPSAVVVGTGYIAGRRLTFDKSSQDGSGKCDAELTGDEADRVYGVIFEISRSENAALDIAEGLGKGYEVETIEVVTPESTIFAQTYIATKKDTDLKPYHWYKALTLAGAIEHGLPSDYVESIQTSESVEDPSASRRERNRALLDAI